MQDFLLSIDRVYCTCSKRSYSFLFSNNIYQKRQIRLLFLFAACLFLIAYIENDKQSNMEFERKVVRMITSEILEKFSDDELITEAECLEEYGEYIHMELLGFSSKEIRDFVVDRKKIHN